MQITVTDSLRDRFMAKVSKNPVSGCWNWTGATRGNGYGAIKISGKVVDAHRASYMIHSGAVPEGHDVAHKCDNKLCVNPDHLEAVTRAENMRQAVDRGQVKPFRPIRTEPLTDAEIGEIRDQYAAGVSARQLSRKFNVPFNSLRRLVGLESE